ncbi:MAG: hypothetical protein WAW75_10970 [Gallionella sp.]
MFKFLESLIRGTKPHAAATPPSRRLSFYWHFISQTPWPYVARLGTSWCAGGFWQVSEAQFSKTSNFGMGALPEAEIHHYTLE